MFSELLQLFSFLALALLTTGCLHYVEPVEPPLLAFDDVEANLPVRHDLVVLNGYEEKEIRSIRQEWPHSLKLDLRSWTQRLVDGLHRELERRGVVLPRRATERPDSAELAWSAPRDAAAPTLRVWVLDFKVPSSMTGSGAELSCRIESSPPGFTEVYSSGADGSGFVEAYQRLEKRILEDPGLLSWLKDTESPTGS